jgi:hypothetical protein
MGAPVIGRALSRRNHCLQGGEYIADLGYLDWGCIAARREAGSYTLTRAQARTMYWTPEGKPLKLDPLLPRACRTNQRADGVRVAQEHRYLMRLLIIRVPEEVAKRRRADLEEEALRRNRPIRQRAWELADWTILRDVCACSPPQFAGGSGAPAGTLANGDALQTVEAIRTD